jgi:hypothetical protein
MSNYLLCDAIKALVYGALSVAAVVTYSMLIDGATMQPFSQIATSVGLVSLAIWAALAIDCRFNLSAKLCAKAMNLRNPHQPPPSSTNSNVGSGSTGVDGLTALILPDSKLL